MAAPVGDRSSGVVSPANAHAPVGARRARTHPGWRARLLQLTRDGLIDGPGQAAHQKVARRTPAPNKASRAWPL
jgi:hypothetical protein